MVDSVSSVNGTATAAQRPVSAEVELKQFTATRAGEEVGGLGQARTFDLDPSWTSAQAVEAAKNFAGREGALALATDLAIVRRPDGGLAAVYGPNLRELQAGDRVGARGSFAGEVLEIVKGPASAKGWVATAATRELLPGVKSGELAFAKQVIAKPNQWSVLRGPAGQQPPRGDVGIVGGANATAASFQVSATSLPSAPDVRRVYVDVASDAEGLKRVRLMGRGPARELGADELAANPAAAALGRELVAAAKEQNQARVAQAIDQLHTLLAPPRPAPKSKSGGWSPS